jgi:ABC-type Mn2+/Zn2+ transport system permease subunit
MRRAREFLLYGTCGAVIGALLGLALSWYIGVVSVVLIGAVAAVCFILSGIFGDRALDWLKEIANWT